jgi:hypothetical protein
MNTAIRLGIFRMGFAIGLFSVSVFGGQQTKEVAAPVPEQMVTAKRVFISNAGGESVLFPSDFSGTPDRAYNQFYAAIKSWGRYELVPAPAEADLVLEIRLTAPIGRVDVTNGDGSSWTDPQFRLVILDPKTHVGLWTFIEHIHWAYTHATRGKNLDQAIAIYRSEVKNRDKNFDQAMANMVADVKKLTASSRPEVPAGSHRSPTPALDCNMLIHSEALPLDQP